MPKTKQLGVFADRKESPGVPQEAKECENKDSRAFS